jgi:hypothetical protein
MCVVDDTPSIYYDDAAQEAAAEFGSMDENGGGVVLFDEFCGWALRRQETHASFEPLCILKVIILPGQARDKHKEKLRKEMMRFLQAY